MQLVNLALDILLEHLSIKDHFGDLSKHATRVAAVRVGNLGGVGTTRCEDAAAGEDVDPFADGLEPTVEDVFGVAGLLGGDGSRFQAEVHRNKNKRI
jgi:hypothetical protein